MCRRRRVRTLGGAAETQPGGGRRRQWRAHGAQLERHRDTSIFLARQRMGHGGTATEIRWSALLAVQIAYM